MRPTVMATGTTKLGYVKQTQLSEDFRTLLVPKPKPQTPRRVVDYCPVCLNEFVDARTLPCFHMYCKHCLQYTIDKAPPDPDQDRGFMCILCGFFVRVCILQYFHSYLPASLTPLFIHLITS